MTLWNALKLTWLAGGVAFTFLVLQLGYETAQRQRLMNSLAFDLHENAKSLLLTQAQARDTMRTVAAETRALRGSVETQTAYALIALNAQLSTANEVLLRTGWSVSASAAAIADDADGVAAGAKQIESQVSDLISSNIQDEFLDCEGLGASCLQNNVFNTLRAVRLSAEAVEREMPRIAAHLAQTSENTAAITKDLRRSPWLKVFHFLKFW